MRRGEQHTFSSSRQLVPSRTFAAPSRAALAAAAMATVGGLFAPAASADTWDGGGADANWQTANNWLDDTAPVSPEPLIFTGNAQTTNNNDFAANTLFNGID